jgi:hypothetical protein
VSSLAVCGEIKVFNLLANDPISHRINVITDNLASEPIRFEQRCTSPHERIANSQAIEIIGLEIDLT